MAKVKRCDRCGVIYQNNQITKNCEVLGGINLCNRHDESLEETHKDLCDDCLKSLDKWLQEGSKIHHASEKV